MAERLEKLALHVELRFDPAKEDRRGALSQVLIAMGEGVANGLTEGELASGGRWELRNGKPLVSF